MVFLPLPIEYLGGWHELTVQQIKKLGAAQGRQTGKKESQGVPHLFQRLAVLLTNKGE